MYTTSSGLDDRGRMVDMRPQAMDQTANPEFMIIYSVISREKDKTQHG
jgi:hypothetical protein